ncbi:hypothetical protein ACFVZ4_09785, partial [Streptomyces goshikiensis]
AFLTTAPRAPPPPAPRPAPGGGPPGGGGGGAGARPPPPPVADEWAAPSRVARRHLPQPGPRAWGRTYWPA